MPSYTALKGCLGIFSSAVQQHLGFAHSSGFEIILDYYLDAGMMGSRLYCRSGIC